MSNPHLDATKGWLEYSAEQNPDNDGRALHAAALAQTEATLALAFEARTANLLTLHQNMLIALTNGFTDGEAAFKELNDIAKTIETRLGLGDPK